MRPRCWLPKMPRRFQVLNAAPVPGGEDPEPRRVLVSGGVSVRLLGPFQAACVIFPLELQSD